VIAQRTRPGQRGLDALALSVIGIALCAAPASGAMTAYFTLDNPNDATTPGSGLKNLGTLGSNSNLVVSGVPAGGGNAPLPVTGFIGGGVGTGALSFDGVDDGLLTNTSSDAADDLSGYSYTMSLWMNAPASSGGTTMGLSATASFNRYFNLGNSSGTATINRRNTTATGTSSGVPLPNEWQHVAGVFLNTTTALIYVNGKLAATQSTSAISSVDPNSLSIGNIYRTSSGVYGPFSAYKGALDDAGLFNTALAESDIALINGLGQTGRLGLDWLDEAQALNASALETTALINGVRWERVSGLVGAMGDFGGTVAGKDAYIITGPDGNGIAIPEPALAGPVIGLGVMLLRRTRKRR
jgi:hypothetical protein